MSKVEDGKTKHLSALRLRLGIFCILVWWIPIWLLVPLIAEALNTSTNSSSVTAILVIVAVIQTIIGLFGVFILGKTILVDYKNIPKKQAIKKLWHTLIHGE